MQAARDLTTISALREIEEHGKPQLKALVKHLKTDGISQYEAIMVHRIAALPRRIADIEKYGVEILRTRKKDSTARGYVKYSLTKEVIKHFKERTQ